MISPSSWTVCASKTGNALQVCGKEKTRPIRRRNDLSYWRARRSRQCPVGCYLVQWGHKNRLVHWSPSIYPRWSPEPRSVAAETANAPSFSTLQTLPSVPVSKELVRGSHTTGALYPSTPRIPPPRPCKAKRPSDRTSAVVAVKPLGPIDADGNRLVNDELDVST